MKRYKNMLNKNKALTNFILGYITTVLLVITFVTLANLDTFMGDVSGTGTPQVAGISFGISFLVIGFVYTMSTLIFSTSEKFKKAPIALLLTSLAMSLLIAFSVAVFDLTINSAQTLVWIVVQMIIFSICILALIFFIQEFNTKFVMSSIAANRADEWEYVNFIKLSINRISINHKEDHTLLIYKGMEFPIVFVSEEIIERKVFLSGDMKTKSVSDLELLTSEKQKAAIVYLSNTLPYIEGENKKVSVIKNEELTKFVKEVYNEEKQK